jgi:hypothetical protein
VIVVPSSAPFVEEEYTAEDFTDHLKVSAQDMGATAPGLFIPIDILIHPLMTDRSPVLVFQPTMDLFRAPGLPH